MSTLLRWIFALVLASAATARLAAYEPDGGELWPDGTITMHLQMGSSPTLSDGSTYNTSLDEALKQWNRNLGRVQFTSVIGSSVPVSRGNGYNNVTLRNDIYGQAFGENVIAVALWRTNDTTRIEGDVIFNKEETWDSYRGPLTYPKYDIRRVALHEFGHVLGLTHPDEAGQYVTAVMNSRTSNVDALQVDDRQGAASLYGVGLDNPFSPPYINWPPNDVTVAEGQTAKFSVNAGGVGSLSYQWRKNGAPIAGAKSVEYTLAAVRPSDAGAYSVAVTNIGGTIVSAEATLTVTPAEKPAFGSQLADLSAEIGSWALFWSPPLDGTSPFKYQWYKDGVALPGETHSGLNVQVQSMAAAGIYTLEVSNAAGAVRTNEAVLTPLLPSFPGPPFISLYSVPVLGKQLILESSLGNSATPWRLQWFKDGRPILGATDRRLIVSSAASTDAGEYGLMVINSAGAISSSTLDVRFRDVPSYSNYTWRRARRKNDVIYFLYTSPSRIERYDVQLGWLSPIPLTGDPRDFDIGDDGFYVTDGAEIKRYALDGTSAKSIATLSSSIDSLSVWRDFLVICHSPSMESVVSTLRRTDGTLVSKYTIWGSYSNDHSDSMAAGEGRLFFHFRSASSGGAEIATLPVNTDGTFATHVSHPTSSYIDRWSRTWVGAAGQQVVDSSGTVFRASDLNYAGSLGTAITDVASFEAGWLALRDDLLALYDEHFRLVGRAKLLESGAALYVTGTEALIFSPPADSTSRPRLTRLALSDIKPVQAGTAQAAPRAVLSIDDLFIDKDGVVNILSRLYQSVFRWLPATRSFTDSIPLQGGALQAVYSPQLNHVAVRYRDAATRIEFSSSSRKEIPFITIPSYGYATGFLPLDTGWLLTTPGGGISKTTYSSYDGGGVLLGQRSQVEGLAPQLREWNQAARRLYSYSAGGETTISALPVAADGTPGDAKRITIAYSLRRPPMRISPDGSVVVLGSGQSFDGATLQPIGPLPSQLDDAAWINGSLYTARNLPTEVEIQSWQPDKSAAREPIRIPGRLLRLFPWGDDKLVLVGLRDGYLFFAVIGADLTIHSIDENKPQVRLANLASRAQVGTGHKILISGFVIGGTGKKNLLLRAVGPTLADYGVSGELANPRITLFNSQGAAMTGNDDWLDASNLPDLVAHSKTIGAADLRDASKDAALLVSLDPGLYTAHVTGVGDTTGVGLVELFDADDRESTARLLNISTRAQVGTGDGILIPGIIVEGDGPATVLIRAIGPGLAKQGVADFLADPKLQVLDRSAKPLVSNDNWSSNSNLANLSAISKQVGAAPLDNDSKDAAVVATLAPGIYTVHVQGVNDTTGVALVEVFYAGP
ncbi:MAG TPA: immunoglobulin domain-containing protein [Opitutaceae bacterium]